MKNLYETADTMMPALLAELHKHLGERAKGKMYADTKMDWLFFTVVVDGDLQRGTLECLKRTALEDGTFKQNFGPELLEWLRNHYAYKFEERAREDRDQRE